MIEKEYDDILHNIQIMETVEKEMEKQRKDATLCFTALIISACIWVMLVKLWELLNEPIPEKYMTVGIEIMSIGLLLFVLKFTRISPKKLGVTRQGAKKAIVNALIFSVSFIIVMSAIKYFSTGELVIDYARFNPAYALTALLQEFIARGFMLSCFTMMYPYKHGKMLSVICSSLFFATIHLYYGFIFMTGAMILSVILATIYFKDKNIWGVSIIHFLLGMSAMMLHLV